MFPLFAWKAGWQDWINLNVSTISVALAKRKSAFNLRTNCKFLMHFLGKKPSGLSKSLFAELARACLSKTTMALLVSMAASLT